MNNRFDMATPAVLAWLHMTRARITTVTTKRAPEAS